MYVGSRQKERPQTRLVGKKEEYARACVCMCDLEGACENRRRYQIQSCASHRWGEECRGEECRWWGVRACVYDGRTLCGKRITEPFPARGWGYLEAQKQSLFCSLCRLEMLARGRGTMVLVFKCVCVCEPCDVNVLFVLMFDAAA